jgi:hypothetical protein
VEGGGGGGGVGGGGGGGGGHFALCPKSKVASIYLIQGCLTENTNPSCVSGG